MPFGQEGLVVTLVGPVPKAAKVTFADEEIFNAAAQAIGPEFPADFPGKYTENLQKVEIFNSSMFWDIEELARWERRHGIEVKKEPLSIHEDYLKAEHVIFATLVEHPKVPMPQRFVACSVVLQRGVIIWNPDPGRETLFLRSYMHSSEGSGNFVNFVPRGGIQISFASEAIWFPLELTRVIQEPNSYVVLDILTQKQLNTGQLPKPFRLEKTGWMQHRGRIYHVARIAAKLSGKEKWPDLRLRPQP
jgi:hypothetical protein